MDRHVEEGEEPWQQRLQFRFQCGLGLHLLVDVAHRVPDVDLEVRPEEIAHRKVGDTLPVRRRVRREY